MTPTDEQAEAVRLFSTGGSLAVEAGAGTGKTSTLVLLSQVDRARLGQYLAFNKALVDDSRGKFHPNVGTNTAHSLAFRGMRPQRELGGQRMYAKEIAQRLYIRPITTTDFQGRTKRLSPGFLAGQVKQAIANYCRSADGLLTDRHFPIIKGLDRPDTGVPLNAYAVREELLPYARTMWDDLCRPAGQFPFEHDHYLKQWQLSDPRIPADYVLFDEAQDANPVIADIVRQQAKYGTQLVLVGDTNQQIYEWTGAIDALSKFVVDHRSRLTQSFRFGPAIAEVANAILSGLPTDMRLTGTPSIASKVGLLDVPQAILTRTNAVGLQRLIELQELGRRAALVGGGKDLLAFVKGVDDLQLNGWTSHPQLSSFSSWDDVRQYVELDPDDDAADLFLLVRLVDTFGVPKLLAALQSQPSEQGAEVIISTAHKAKGREWDTVQLTQDFNGKVAPAPLRLLYVAATRAKLTLDPYAVEQIVDTLSEEPADSTRL